MTQVITPLPTDPFSTEPKTSLQSFYDREAELHQIQRAMSEGRKLILVLGVRRVGKTSLIRVALNQLDKPYIFVDLRALKTYEDRSLYSLLSEELNRITPFSKRIFQFLKRVRGISVGDGVVSLSLGRYRPSIISILKMLDSWAVADGFRLPIVLDEA
ncbi:MAG: ATP-binding protein [Nitrososphaerota archaeon]